MMNKICYSSIVLSVLLVLACNDRPRRVDQSLIQNPELIHKSVKKLTDIIVYDIFSPPVAGRIYAYTSLAAYEAIRFQEPQYPSLAAQMRDFPPMPRPPAEKICYPLAAVKAFFTVAAQMTFSRDSLLNYERKCEDQFRKAGITNDEWDRSVAFGHAVGKKILERAATDNYKESRGYPRYTPSGERGKWKPTAPDYMDAIEPYWNTLKPFVIDSPGQFKPVAPPSFDLNAGSEYYKQVMEVYNVVKHADSTQREIANFWDCNPFVMNHTGHAMFATKKITPGGHWMGITAIACRVSKADIVKTAQAYAVTATALHDAFISCWDEKYRSAMIRPITVISEHIDQSWQPLLQTPPFPEYTSGHSVISAAASVALTRMFGDHVAFTDTSEVEYGAGKRQYASFIDAAEEAAISRLYGGIHYRAAIDNGIKEGRQVGNYILGKVKLSKAR